MLSKKMLSIIHVVLAVVLLYCAKSCKKTMAEGTAKRCWQASVLTGALLAVWHGRCLYKEMTKKGSSEESA